MTQLMTDEGRMVRVPAGTWKVDPAHSSVAFEVHMMISTVRGHFREFEGTLEAADDDPADSRARGSVKVASIDTGNAERDQHLRSPDFFDADRYPEIRFVSTAVDVGDNGELEVEGDLTIKDRTHRVTARGAISGPHVDIAGNEKVGVELDTVVDRREFGLDWNAELPNGGYAVANDVRLEVSLELVKEA